MGGGHENEEGGNGRGEGKNTTEKLYLNTTALCMAPDDEEVNKRAAEWVRGNTFVKGRPNMTAQSFCVWVNKHLLPSCHLAPHFPRSVLPHGSSLALSSWS